MSRLEAPQNSVEMNGARPRNRARCWAQRLALPAVAGILLLAALDLLLRFDPLVFGENRANAVFSRYDNRPGGIYVQEERSGMRFMWAEFATENYWNG